MLHLRGGAFTLDRRLDRLEYHDLRSRKFSIRDAVTDRKPRSYTWRCEAHFDQGAEGACVGFGMGHELAARPAEVHGLSNRFCRERIYWEAQKVDGWPGGAYPGASPEYEGTSVTAGAQIVRRLGYADEFRWSLSFDDFLLGLSHAGPAVLGIAFREGMMEPDSEGYITPTGAEVGGHCILCTQLDLADGRDRARVHNSWGTGWGPLGGDAWIRLQHLRSLLADGGEACFFLRRHTIPQS